MLALLSRIRDWFEEHERAQRLRDEKRLNELHEHIKSTRSRLHTRCVADGDARGCVHARQEIYADLSVHTKELFRLAARLGRPDLIAAYY